MDMDFADLNRTISAAAGKAQKSQGLSVQSFLASLAVYGSICVAVLIFEQSRQSPDRNVSRLSSGWHAWFSRLPKLSLDEELITEQGMDGYFFLRLLRTALKMFLPLTAIIIPLLLPLDLTAGASAAGLDKLSWANLQMGQIARFWGHLVAALVVVAYVCYILVSEFRELIRIRQVYLLKSCHSQHQSARIVLVTDIPKSKLHEDTLARDYARFNGGPVKIWINRDVSSLTRIVEKRNRLVCKLEAVLTEELRQTRKSLLKRFRKDSDGRTPMSIARDIQDLNKKITQQQKDIKSFRKLPSAFLQFADPVTAHQVQQVVADSVPLSMVPHMIAADNDVIWSNLSLRWWQRFIKKLIIVGCVIGLTVFWVVPIALTGLLSQVVYLDGKIAWVQRLSDSALGRMWLGLIQGLVPQLLLSILMVLFPEILLALVRRQGQVTRSAIELSLQGHYFVFLFLQVFLVVSISSSITTVIPEVLNNLQSAPSILAKNVPKASDYFYSYLLLQAVTQCALSLRQLPNAIWQWLLMLLWAQTPRKNWSCITQRSMMRWGLVYPVFTNLACICKFVF
ncbi:hypothetical protein VTN00DRAFT_2746 [Thermoascus crustaceus]|uniref:uncharacterized protein n=1 Tax=Thermoascus crustaceus TaxID=5088 RepID=UPI0037422168